MFSDGIDCNARAGRNDHGRQHERIRADTAAAKCRHEARSRSEPHRVDEQHEPERPQGARHLELRIRHPECQAGEQHRSDPEAKARDAYPTSQVADRGDDEDEQEWVIAENAHAAREPTNRRLAASPLPAIDKSDSANPPGEPVRIAGEALHRAARLTPRPALGAGREMRDCRRCTGSRTSSRPRSTCAASSR